MADTQIASRQIVDGAITDAKVAAGAAIATSKLADAANFILRGGTIPFTADQSMGGFKLTNVGAPASGSDAANKTYVDGLIAGLNSIFDSKASVVAASTVNITTSNPATSTFDGVTVTVGDRILLKNQTTPSQNGIWIFATSSTAMTRATDMDAWAEVPGAFVAVETGTLWADTVWLCTADAGGTINTTAITWQQIPTTPGLLAANFVNREIPTGLINGSNTTYSLANTPTTGTERVYLNGLLQEQGSGKDYTISGATITMTTAPLTGEKLVANYMK